MGTLHSLWAMLVFEVAGEPSRTAALAVNMLLFLAWQAALVGALRRGTGSWTLGWMAIGLTLALRCPWFGVQGSATDYRLDHATMCMMGISLAAALQTRGLRSVGWSATFGAAVGVTLLTRFLSGTYFFLIFLGVAGWIALCGPERLRRSLNLGLAAVVAAAFFVPCLWVNRQLVYEHYWIGHYYDADGALWISHASLGEAVRNFWVQLGADQLGAAFGLAAAAGLAVLAAGALRSRDATQSAGTPARNTWARESAILGALFLAAPAIVLPLQNQPFGVVLGVAVPGTLCLLLALASSWRTKAGRGYRVAATGAALAIGAGYFVARQVEAPYDAGFMADNHRVKAVADRIFRTAQAGGIKEPQIVVDRIADYFDAQILRVVCYERRRIWMPFAIALPVGLSAIPEDTLMTQLARGDFVLVTEAGPPGPWPYDRQTLAMRPKILTWCEANLQLAERFTVFGQQMALYQRPDCQIPLRETGDELRQEHTGLPADAFRACSKHAPRPAQLWMEIGFNRPRPGPRGAFRPRTRPRHR
jgi:hypothetical protein